MSSDHDARHHRHPRFLMALAYLFTLAAVLDVVLAFSHRQSIVAMWQDLKRRSYPPYEAYETLGIDMEAGFGFLGFTCAWLVLQLASLIVYLCICRSMRLGGNLAFGFLWLFSLAGAIAYHIVIRTAGWGDDILQ